MSNYAWGVMSVEAYPLSWPAGRPRTAIDDRERSRFKITPDRARKELFIELERMDATDVILSTNLPIRKDGMPYMSGMSSRALREDPGVAVYFKSKGRPMVFACDRWDRIEDNLQAIRHTIAALRGINRWGSGDMLERAFTGFTALPAPIAVAHWTDILGVSEEASLDLIEGRYRTLAKLNHPDRDGCADKMAELNRAITEARAAKAGAA